MRECGLRALVCGLRDAPEPHISGTGSHAAAHWLQDLTQGWSELETQGRFDALPARLLLVHAEPAAGQEQGLLSVGRPSCLERRQNEIAICADNLSVRNEDQFRTYLAASSSSRRPLLTLWTTSYCQTCQDQVAPLLKSLVDSGVGEAEGGVGYCEIELDAPDVMTSGLGLTYMISSVPTLMSFDAGEAQFETKVADGNRLKDRRFLEEWIRTEARRHGGRGGGGGGAGGGSVFGGLFGSFKG